LSCWRNAPRTTRSRPRTRPQTPTSAVSAACSQASRPGHRTVHGTTCRTAGARPPASGRPRVPGRVCTAQGLWDSSPNDPRQGVRGVHDRFLSLLPSRSLALGCRRPLARFLRSLDRCVADGPWWADGPAETTCTGTIGGTAQIRYQPLRQASAACPGITQRAVPARSISDSGACRNNSQPDRTRGGVAVRCADQCRGPVKSAIEVYRSAAFSKAVGRIGSPGAPLFWLARPGQYADGVAVYIAAELQNSVFVNP